MVNIICYCTHSGLKLIAYTKNIQDIIESTIWNVLIIINVCVYPEMYFEQVFVCDFLQIRSDYDHPIKINL